MRANYYLTYSLTAKGFPDAKKKDCLTLCGAALLTITKGVLPSPLATTGWGRSQKEALLFRAGDILLVEDKLGSSFPFHQY